MPRPTISSRRPLPRQPPAPPAPSRSRPPSPGPFVSPEYERKQIPHWTEFGELEDSDIQHLADELADLNAKKKLIEELIEVQKSMLQAVMEDVPISKVSSYSVRINDQMLVQYMKPEPRATIVRELLIQQGVTEKQLTKATKLSPVKPYVVVRVTAAKDEEGE